MFFGDGLRDSYSDWTLRSNMQALTWSESKQTAWLKPSQTGHPGLRARTDNHRSKKVWALWGQGLGQRSKFTSWASSQNRAFWLSGKIMFVPVVLITMPVFVWPDKRGDDEVWTVVTCSPASRRDHESLTVAAWSTDVGISPTAKSASMEQQGISGTAKMSLICTVWACLQWCRSQVCVCTVWRSSRWYPLCLRSLLLSVGITLLRPHLSLNWIIQLVAYDLTE